MKKLEQRLEKIRNAAKRQGVTAIALAFFAEDWEAFDALQSEAESKGECITLCKDQPIT